MKTAHFVCVASRAPTKRRAELGAVRNWMCGSRVSLLVAVAVCSLPGKCGTSRFHHGEAENLLDAGPGCLWDWLGPGGHLSTNRFGVDLEYVLITP